MVDASINNMESICDFPLSTINISLISNSNNVSLSLVLKKDDIVNTIYLNKKLDKYLSLTCIVHDNNYNEFINNDKEILDNKNNNDDIDNSINDDDNANDENSINDNSKINCSF